MNLLTNTISVCVTFLLGSRLLLSAQPLSSTTAVLEVVISRQGASAPYNYVTSLVGSPPAIAASPGDPLDVQLISGASFPPLETWSMRCYWWAQYESSSPLLATIQAFSAVKAGEVFALGSKEKVKKFKDATIQVPE